MPGRGFNHLVSSPPFKEIINVHDVLKFTVLFFQINLALPNSQLIAHSYF